MKSAGRKVIMDKGNSMYLYNRKTSSREDKPAKTDLKIALKSRGNILVNFQTKKESSNTMSITEIDVEIAAPKIP